MMGPAAPQAWDDARRPSPRLAPLPLPLPLLSPSGALPPGTQLLLPPALLPAHLGRVCECNL